MNWLDLVLIVILVVAAFIGLRIGIIKAVLSLAGVVLGVILAGRFYNALAPSLAFIPQENMARIVAFAIILIGVMVIAGILAGVLKWLASLVLLGWLNRLGGAALGLLLGILFSSALLAIWARILGTGAIGDSALANLLLDNFPLVLALLPEEFGSIRSFFQ